MLLDLQSTPDSEPLSVSGGVRPDHPVHDGVDWDWWYGLFRKTEPRDGGARIATRPADGTRHVPLGRADDNGRFAWGTSTPPRPETPAVEPIQYYKPVQQRGGYDPMSFFAPQLRPVAAFPALQSPYDEDVLLKPGPEPVLMREVERREAIRRRAAASSVPPRQFPHPSAGAGAMLAPAFKPALQPLGACKTEVPGQSHFPWNAPGQEGHAELYRPASHDARRVVFHSSPVQPRPLVRAPAPWTF